MKKQTTKKTNKTAKNKTRLTGEIIEGRLNGNAKGFGFLQSESGEFYIPRDGMNGARHGDTVKARKIPNTDNAHITEVLSRKHNTLTGIFRRTGGGGYIEPDDRHFAEITIKSAEAKGGQRVAVALDDNGDGRIIEVLENDGGLDGELKAVIYQYGLEEKFSRAAIKNASEVAIINQKDYEGRLDLRDSLIFTIDGDDSRDFDDAVSIKKLEGGYELGVHIADVAHYVRANSALDKEAFKRGTSVYFPTAVLPMLPENLSNGICSLDENVDRLTLSVIMQCNASGKVTSHRIAESVIASKARMTYRKTAAILEGDAELCKQYQALVAPLKDMRDFAAILTKKRHKRGALNFETFEPDFTILDGKVTDLKKADRLITHSIIEEFMVLTNETVAEHFNNLSAPFVYRVHSAPPPEKMERLNLFLTSMGISLSATPSQPDSKSSKKPVRGKTSAPALKSKDIQALLASADPAVAPVLNKALLRAMAKAVYEPHCKGHYGLASTYYCHFTSPIRRYPDLMIHRIIKSSLRGEALKKFTEFAAEGALQSTQREIAAEEAERKFNDILAAKYMENHIGEAFKGVVSGVTDWGVFVELDNTAEGLIRAESLEGEYSYDEASMTLKGEHIFRLGTAVEIEVAAVRGDRIEFNLKSVC